MNAVPTDLAFKGQINIEEEFLMNYPEKKKRNQNPEFKNLLEL